MKKSGLISFAIVLSLCLLLSFSFVSASWFDDFWGKLTREDKLTGNAIYQDGNVFLTNSVVELDGRYYHIVYVETGRSSCAELDLDGYGCTVGTLDWSKYGLGSITGAFVFKDVTNCGGSAFDGKDLETLLSWSPTETYTCLGNKKMRMYSYYAGSACGTAYSFRQAEDCASAGKTCSNGACVAPCTPVNGVLTWGAWSDIGSCGSSVGFSCKQKQSRSQSCTTPPSCGGAGCGAIAAEIGYVNCGNGGNYGCSSGQVCSNGACVNSCSPVNGGWSSWGSCMMSSITSDEVECGTGTQTRTCTNPSPSCGGSQCSGSSTQSCSVGCLDGQTCTNGVCVTDYIKCSVNSDCGTDTTNTTKYCSGDNRCTSITTTTHVCNIVGDSNVGLCVIGSSASTGCSLCANGCSEGICINSTNQTPTCIDSDGDENYYVKGTVRNGSLSGKDYCWKDGSYPMNDSIYVNKLREYSCTLNQTPLNPNIDGFGGPLGTGYYEINYNCPNGCQDGACIPPKYTQITSVNVSGEDSNVIKFHMTLAENIPANPGKYIGYVFALDTDKKYNTPGQFTVNDIGNDYNVRVYFEENDQQWHAGIDQMGVVTNPAIIPPALIFDVSGNAITVSVPKININYSNGLYLVGSVAFESDMVPLTYPLSGHISYPAEQVCSSLIDSIKNPQSTDDRRLSWNKTYSGKTWVNNQNEKYTEYRAGWDWNSPEYNENQMNYYYVYYDVQIFDNQNINLSEYASWQENNFACKKTSHWTNENQENPYYICNWNVLNNNQDTDNYNENNRELFWYNGNVVVRMNIYWGQQLTDQQITQLSQQRISDLLNNLQNNQYQYIDWSNFNIDWPAANELYNTINSCGSDVRDEGGYQSWSCKTEPIICPAHGYQTKTCNAYNYDTETYDTQTVQISCSPGICDGCYVPKWFGDVGGETKCIPYGFRFAKESGYTSQWKESEDIESFKESDSDSNQVILDVVSSDSALFTFFGEYDNGTSMNTTYILAKGDVIRLGDIPGWESNADTSLEVMEIFYSSEEGADNYITFKITYYYLSKEIQTFDAYCDIDGEIKMQKTKDPTTGGWALCQNSYECDSNLCSSGECVEILDMTAYLDKFKVTGVKVFCKLANLFSIEDYSQCLISYSD